jgi:hypothetical protein
MKKAGGACQILNQQRSCNETNFSFFFKRPTADLSRWYTFFFLLKRFKNNSGFAGKTRQAKKEKGKVREFVVSRRRSREREKKTRKSPPPKNHKHAIYPGRPFRLFSPFLSSGKGKKIFSSGIEPFCRPCYACENRAPRFAARQGGYRVAARRFFFSSLKKSSSFLTPCQLCPDISSSLLNSFSKKTGLRGGLFLRVVVVVVEGRRAGFKKKCAFFVCFFSFFLSLFLNLAFLPRPAEAPPPRGTRAADACCSQSS